MTASACNQYKQEQRIHRAQADALQEAGVLMAVAGIMVLFLANLPLVLFRLGQFAAFCQATAEFSLALGPFGVAAAVFFGALFVVTTVFMAYLSGSEATLALGVAADGILAGMFAERSSDNNPADWTPAAVAKFSSTVDASIGLLDMTEEIMSVYSGKSILGKILGAFDPSADALYQVQTINATFTQMNNDLKS
jgi:hypothetical protein